MATVRAMLWGAGASSHPAPLAATSIPVAMAPPRPRHRYPRETAIVILHRSISHMNHQPTDNDADRKRGPPLVTCRAGKPLPLPPKALKSEA